MTKVRDLAATWKSTFTLMSHEPLEDRATSIARRELFPE